MTKIKTPLMLAIEKIENKIDSHPDGQKVMSHNNALEIAIDILQQLLPVEREQIMDAHKAGSTEGRDWEIKHAEQYFTNTYEQ